MSSQQGFTFVLLGGGGRGNLFSNYLEANPGAGRIVAIAEPVAQRRKALAQKHSIPADMQFESWEALLAKPRLADGVINTLMDRLHAPSAIAALDKGYWGMLLEKPMATSLEDCIAIDAARQRNNAIVALCHSLRYHRVYAEIKRLIVSGAIGEIASIDQLESVEPMRQAHSFVRGNWGNTAHSTFMLMGKSCHDLDIISYLVGKPCKRVSSFGSLTYFNKAHAPTGAPARCTDGCPAEVDCPYSAYKIYLCDKPDFNRANHAGIRDQQTWDQKLAIMQASPYGRCVFRCDNDVVDHQVVSFEFDGQITGTFTMMAFALSGRVVRINGTAGAIDAAINENRISLTRWSDRAVTTINVPAQPGAHGGADGNVMMNLVQAMRRKDPHYVLTGTAESLASHKIVFAAEKARLENRVVELSELEDPAAFNAAPVAAGK